MRGLTPLRESGRHTRCKDQSDRAIDQNASSLFSHELAGKWRGGRHRILYALDLFPTRCQF